jgi:hypothetical protein
VTDVPPNSDLSSIIAATAPGRTYRLAAGNHTISSPIRITSPADLAATVCLVGTSPQEVFVLVETGVPSGLFVDDVVDFKLALKGLTIDGQGTSSCIHVTSTQFALQDAVVRNCRNTPALSMLRMTSGSSLVSVVFSSNQAEPASAVDVGEVSPPDAIHQWQDVSDAGRHLCVHMFMCGGCSSST